MVQSNVAPIKPNNQVMTQDPGLAGLDDKDLAETAADANADAMEERLKRIQQDRDNSPETYMQRWVQGTETMIVSMDKRRQEYVDGLKAAYQVELNRANEEVAMATKLMEDAMAVAKTQGERIHEIMRLNAAHAAEVENLVNAAEATFSKMIAGQKQAIETATAAKEGT